ncbi:amino acid adenylation domain-containing protein, partial [Streptomyces sp. NPDC059762]|uniref:amino acid adenylation domain-containing protein n=1 Tax=Streptomyces sp. NPDC059762 TaxID=3346938 RepID=UPI003649AEDA
MTAFRKNERFSPGTEYAELLGRLRARPPRAHASRACASTAPGPSSWSSAGAAVAACCSAFPDETALSDGYVDVTYAELDERVNALAHVLLGHGAGPGDVIALVMDRGMEYAVAALAVWRTGAAFLPLSPGQPEDWRARVARQAGARLALGHPVTGLTAVVNAGVTGPVEPVEDRNGPDDLAYVIATSGSTGAPKLVMNEHRGLAHLMTASREPLGGVPVGSRVIQFSQPAFDASVLDLLTALTNGARLESLEATDTDHEDLGTTLARRRITHAVLPAAVVRTLRPEGLTDLGVLVSVGDVCLPETARLWAGHLRFVNGYGPSEASVWSGYHVCTGEEQERVPIGRPLTGTEILVLDRDGLPAPDGAVGELCVTGPGVGRGYTGRPDLTAERFLRHPDGGRLYRTGDLGRRLPDGTAEFLGRTDDQVKIRGVRVELGQVESVLTTLPGVRDAVAVIDRRGEEPLLVGYLRADADGPVPRRADLLGTVPSYLVPDRLVVVDRWPLTVAGKVDRAALPRPGSSFGGPESGAESVNESVTRGSTDLSREQRESAVARVAAELLGLDGVGVHDDLFLLGGSSLFAAQVAARLRQAHGLDVSVGAVRAGRTPAAIARAARAASPLDSGPGAEGAAPVPSAGQRRVWLMHRMRPDARAYHAQAVLRLTGALSVPALEASLSDLVRRHEVLRTRFPEEAGEVSCAVDPPWQVDLEVRDLSGRADPAAAVGAEVHALVHAAFDLEKEPPVHWTLLKVAPEEHLLVHVEHHLAHDGWSFRILARELLHGYAAFVTEGAIGLPMPEVTYGDYARWQRDWLRSPEADVQRQFWRDHLAGAETVLRLPRRTDAPAGRFRGRSLRYEIDGELARELARLAHREGVSLFTVLSAAFLVLLHRYSGSSDVLLGSAVANRRWRQTEDVVGMFVNTVVLRGRFDADPAFRDFLRRIHEQVLRVHDHQDLPYDEIFEQSPAAHGDGARPLVQAMFSAHDTPFGELPPMPLAVDILEGLSNGSAKVNV